MTIATLQELKDYLRELTNDLDDPLLMALESASAEVNHFLGFDTEDEFGSSGVPFDIKQACMVLAQVYAEVANPEQSEHYRAAAQSTLIPYRRNTGFGAPA